MSTGQSTDKVNAPFLAAAKACATPAAWSDVPSQLTHALMDFVTEAAGGGVGAVDLGGGAGPGDGVECDGGGEGEVVCAGGAGVETGAPGAVFPVRSEEHTSELQSRSDLVCRLLLEKKKNPALNTTYTTTNIPVRNTADR